MLSSNVTISEPSSRMYQMLFASRQSTTPTCIVCLTHHHASSIYHTIMYRLSTTPSCIIYLPHHHASSIYHTIMHRLSTTPTCIVFLPHQHASSVYHTNMHRLFTTLTCIICLPHQYVSSVYHTNMLVCLPHQHASSVYHTNTKLDTPCNHFQAGPPRPVDCLAPLCINGGTILEVGGPSQHKKQQTFKLLTGIEAKLIVASDLQSIGFVNNSIIHNVLTDHIKVFVF